MFEQFKLYQKFKIAPRKETERKSWLFVKATRTVAIYCLFLTIQLAIVNNTRMTLYTLPTPQKHNGCEYVRF